MKIEKALFFLDIVLHQKILNNVQELVFRQAWAGQTYPEIAESSGYDANYIKDVGYKLWKLLSKAFEEKVTKSNFRSVIRRRYVAYQHAWRASYLSGYPLEYKGSTLTRSVICEGKTQSHVFEGEALSVWTGESISGSGFIVASGEEIASPQDIASEQEIGESQQTSVVNTVLAAPLDAKEIDVNTQYTHTDLFRVTPQFIDAKTTTANTRSYWREALDVSALSGRTEELKTLKQWIVDARCRLVELLGMGGIGKTALSVQSAEQISDEFEYPIWRSLLHAPPVNSIQLLSNNCFSKRRNILIGGTANQARF
jgi:hypothetical protein